MPGIGVAGGDRVALGENTRMLVGGEGAGDLTVQVQNGVMQANFGNLALIRFVNGTLDIGGSATDVTDNMSFGFAENSRGPRAASIAADCFWRAFDNPFSFPPNFLELEETPRILIWPDILNSPGNVFKFPVGFCEGFTITLAGTSDVRFNLRLRSQRRYYTPARPDLNGGVWG